MYKLYNDIYEAVNAGIQKALILADDQSEDTSVKFHNKKVSSEFIPAPLKTVNLGLPSGLLWCEYNLGAFPGNKPEDWYGDYYAWGEDEPKTDYSSKTYRFYDIEKNSENFSYDDNIHELKPEDDTVSNVLNKSYKMPSINDFTELRHNTNQTWVKDYNGIKGLNGMLLISDNNGKTLFFPAGGYYSGMSVSDSGRYCDYWLSSVYAHYMYADKNFVDVNKARGHHGFSVRGVCIS